MKLQNLIYLIEIENARSMSKAAGKLYVSQPALSKGIHELETELGCQLFERNGKKLKLTKEGERCLSYSKKILTLCDEMKESVKNQKTTTFSVGYIIVGYLEFFLNIINSKTELKDISIIPVYGSSNDIQQKLEKSEIELAILPCLKLPESKNIRLKVIDEENIHIMVKKNHPLYNRDDVSIADIKKYKIIIWSLEYHSSIYNSYHDMLIKYGIKEENIISTANIMGDMITLMSIHNGIGLVGPITSSLSQKEYKIIPIMGIKEKLYTCIEWNKKNTDMKLLEMIDYI